MSERWPRRGLLLAAIAIGVLVAAACIDYALTSAALPEFDPTFEFDPSTPGAMDPATAERGRLIDGYGDRVWLYALGMVAAVAALVMAAVRAAPREEHRELFTDLGVAGVACGIAAALISSSAPDLIENSNQGAVVLVPAAALLLAAAVGSLFVRARDGRGAPEPGDGVVADGSGAKPGAQGSRATSLAPTVGWAALGLAALTVVLTLISQGGRECGVSAPGWSDALIWISLITGAAAAICGLAALLARRWIVALLSLPAPVIALLGVAAATCLS